MIPFLRRRGRKGVSGIRLNGPVPVKRVKRGLCARAPTLDVGKLDLGVGRCDLHSSPCDPELLVSGIGKRRFPVNRRVVGGGASSGE